MNRINTVSLQLLTFASLSFFGLYIDQADSIKCAICYPEKPGDCESTNPRIYQCGDSTQQCLKMVLTMNGEKKTSLFCNYGKTEGCDTYSENSICYYVCNTDGCIPDVPNESTITPQLTTVTTPTTLIRHDATSPGPTPTQDSKELKCMQGTGSSHCTDHFELTQCPIGSKFCVTANFQVNDVKSVAKFCSTEDMSGCIEIQDMKACFTSCNSSSCHKDIGHSNNDPQQGVLSFMLFSKGHKSINLRVN